MSNGTVSGMAKQTSFITNLKKLRNTYSRFAAMALLYIASFLTLSLGATFAAPPPPTQTATPTVTDPSAAKRVSTTTYTIAGSHESGNVTINVYKDVNDDGAITPITDTIVATGTANASTYSISTPLLEGANNFLVTATKNPSTESAPADVPTITRDTSAPTNPTDVSSTDHTTSTWSSDNTITMSWSAPGTANGATDADGSSDVNGYYYIFDTNASTVPTTATGTFTSSNSVTSSILADGNTWYFHLRTVDQVGNISTATVHSGPFYIDTTAPTAPGNPSTTSPTTNYSQSWSWTTASDNLGTTNSGLDHYNYWLTDSSSTTVDSGTTTSTSANTTVTSDGTYTLHVTATDVAGNTGPESTGTLIVDTVAPTGPTVTSSTHTVNVPSNVTTVTVDWSGASDDNSGLAGYYIEWNTSATTISGTATPSTPTSTTSDTHDFGSGANGSFYFHIVTFDNAGNSSQVDFGPIVIDTTAPVVTVDSQITSDTTPLLTGTVDDSSATVIVAVGGHSYTATVSGTTWSAQVTNALAPGTYDVVATATDAAGNSGSDTSTNELTITQPSNTGGGSGSGSGSGTGTSNGSSSKQTGNGSSSSVLGFLGNGQVLGASTGGEDQVGSTLGASTNKPSTTQKELVTQANATQKAGKWLGLGWYWLLVLAVVAAIVAYLRRAGTNEAS